MTVKELYELAIKNHAGNYNIAIRFRGDAMDYYAESKEIYLAIDPYDKEIIL